MATIKAPNMVSKMRVVGAFFVFGKQPSALLYVFIIAISLAAVAVAIFLSNRVHRETIRLATEQFNRRQLILARSAATGIEAFIADVYDDLLALSNFPVVQRMEPGILERMEVLYKGIPPETSSRRLDKSGILRFVYPNDGWRKELVGRDYSEDACFQTAKETGTVVLSGLVVNEMGDRRIQVARPVYVEDATGRETFNGVIVGSFDPETLSGLYISPIVSGETGYAWLLKEDGMFLAHHEEEFVGRDAFKVRAETSPGLSYDAINRIQQRMMAGEEGVGRYVSGWHRGEKGKVEKLVAYAPVRAGSHVWSVAVCATVSEVERLTSKAHRNHLYTLGLTILILTGAGASFFLAFYRWSRPLEQEIATRKQAEEGLRETRNYLENLIDYANAPIIVWDPEFKITRFNHAFERLTQKNAGVVLGAGLDILFPDDRREEAMAHIRRTATGERWEAVEIPILRADGTVKTVLWNSATLYAEDGATVVATIAQGQDITGRKRAEEQLQKAHDNLEIRVKERTAELAETNESLNQEITERKRVEEALRLAHGNLKIKAAALKEANKELSEYGYVVSHDIRAPLRAIHNYAEFLREDLEATLEGEQKEYLDGLCRAVRQSEELAEDLLALSRVGRESGPTETIDVGVFLRKLIASLDLPPDVEVVTANDWPAMEVEPTLFRQIFQNLISNAIKFNRSERKRVELGWRPADEGRYELFVRDNGIGIEPRYQEQIFSVFQRLHTRQEYEGSGIGLAVIKKATSKLQGSVRVESKPGAGSTFFIVLPKRQKEG